jgi:CheY-like chemotaxis protein
MKILIVDDSKTSRMLFKAFMPKDGQHEVAEAGNLPDALAKALEMQPYLVVLDFNMPDHNGIEMQQAMLQAGLNPKFALLTANTQKTVVDAALAAGFTLVVEKPVSAVKIASLIAQVS